MKKIGAFIASAAALFGLLGCQPLGQAQGTPSVEMVNLTQELKEYGRAHDEGFLLVGNGSAGLLEVTDQNPSQNIERFLKEIDGIFVESVFYGGDMDDDQKTDAETTKFFEYLLARAQRVHVPVLNLDYCSSPEHLRDSAEQNRWAGYIGMASTRRELDLIPEGKIPKENAENISKLSDVKNFLAVLNPSQYRTRENFLAKLRETNYDLLIIDLYFGDEPLTQAEVASLKRKANGGERIVLSYMSVGEAEDYRSYWKTDWRKNPPEWMDAANENWEGNYKVKYWSKGWKKILYGSKDAYLDKILYAGFDGAFLDVMDAWEYFERH